MERNIINDEALKPNPRTTLNIDANIFFSIKKKRFASRRKNPKIDNIYKKSQHKPYKKYKEPSNNVILYIITVLLIAILMIITATILVRSAKMHQDIDNKNPPETLIDGCLIPHHKRKEKVDTPPSQMYNIQNTGSIFNSKNPSNQSETYQ